MIVRGLAGLGLLVCLIIPFLFFQGKVTDGLYKNVLAWGSLVWFIFATLAMRRRNRV